MAAELNVVCDGLNAPPINAGVTIVTLDAKNPSEISKLLYEVLGLVDASLLSTLRSEPADLAGQKIVSFLRLLNYPMPDDIALFGPSLTRGDKEAVFPVMHYVFSRLAALRKRAYVARYLIPLEIPPEFQYDTEVTSALADHVARQAEFKSAHMAYERVASIGDSDGGANSSGMRRPTPAEIRRELSQLTDERGQLVDRIASMKARTTTVPTFKPLLAATSALRSAQEEESRLAERLLEQRAALASAESRFAAVNRKLAETRAATHGDTNGEAALEAARREAAENRTLSASVLPATIAARRTTLAAVQEALRAPPVTEADVFRLREAVATETDAVSALTTAIAAAQRVAGDEKLALFRQQASLVAKKLSTREAALDAAMRSAAAAAGELEAAEARAAELCGPRYMRRDDFQAYAATLRAKTAKFRDAQAEMGELTQQTTTAAARIRELEERAKSLEAAAHEAEVAAGVDGFTSAQSDLARLSSLKAEIDHGNGETLAEISRVVTEITATIKLKKSQLAPGLQVLRKTRETFAEAEISYLRERAAYEAAAAGYESTNGVLERAATDAGAAADEVESEIAVLQAELAVIDDLAARAKREAAFERGEGRLLAHVRSYSELMAARLTSLESLGAELRVQQRELRESHDKRVGQRAAFGTLQTLLQAKLDYLREPRGGGGAFGSNGGRGGNGGASLDVELTLGGADVMVLGPR